MATHGDATRLSFLLQIFANFGYFFAVKLNQNSKLTGIQKFWALRKCIDKFPKTM